MELRLFLRELLSDSPSIFISPGKYNSVFFSNPTYHFTLFIEIQNIRGRGPVTAAYWYRLGMWQLHLQPAGLNVINKDIILSFCWEVVINENAGESPNLFLSFPYKEKPSIVTPVLLISFPRVSECVCTVWVICCSTTKSEF